LGEVVLNIIKLGLALLALILIKNVLEAIYILELGPCMVGARNFLIVVLEASQTFLGMVWGVEEPELERTGHMVHGIAVWRLVAP